MGSVVKGKREERERATATTMATTAAPTADGRREAAFDVCGRSGMGWVAGLSA
jgi:hypothetical protein